MVIWGIDNFSNDAAEGWLYDFGENDFRLIDRTLAGVAHLLPVDILDAEEAAEALVAAECIAAALGYPALTIPDELEEWLSENSITQVKPDYVEMAQKATHRVLTQSALRDHWQSQSRLAEWKRVVEGLLVRLGDGAI